jgi:hyperosmotically inducible protein
MKTTNEYKAKIAINRVIVMTCFSAVIGLAGCQKEGSAEKAGKKIDAAAEKAQQTIEKTTEQAGQKIEAAKESLDQKAEKAGEKIEGAKESVIDKAETAGEYIDDSVITTKVKAAILNEPMLNASHIEVTTDKGVVKLSGTVDSEPNINRAMEVAKSQENVKSVQTELTVKASAPSK